MGILMKLGLEVLAVASLSTILAVAADEPRERFGSATTSLGDSVDRGAHLYESGASSRGGEVLATFRELRLPGTQLACASCHGPGGRGGVEAGIVVSDIRAKTLFAARRRSDRPDENRPAYTRESLSRVLREGVDPAGRELEELMPRYEIADEDLADLLDFLESFGRGPVPGLGSETLDLGMLMPRSGPTARSALAIQTVVERALEAVNARGGVHGRTLRLRVVECGSTSAEAMRAIEALPRHGDGSVFAFVANSGAGASTEVLAALDRRRVPTLGPIAFDVGDVRHCVFPVLPTFVDQGHAIAEWLRRRVIDDAPASEDQRWASGRRASVSIESHGEAGQAMAQAVRSAAKRHGVQLEEGELEGAAIRLVLGAPFDRSPGSGGAVRPTLVVPTVFLNGPPASKKDLVLMAPPIGPGVWSPYSCEGLDELLRDEATVRGCDRALVTSAYVTTLAVTRALAACGRDLDRNLFLDELTDGAPIRSGVLPPLCFVPGRAAAAGVLALEHDATGALVNLEWVEGSRR